MSRIERTIASMIPRSRGLPAASVAAALDRARGVAARLERDDEECKSALRSMLHRVDLGTKDTTIALDLASLLDAPGDAGPRTLTITVPFERHQPGRARPIVLRRENEPRPDPDLIALVADARRWMLDLTNGKATSAEAITVREGLRKGAVSRILPLAWLAPDIATAILEGRQPTDLTLARLRVLPVLPLDWADQRRLLGFPPA